MAPSAFMVRRRGLRFHQPKGTAMYPKRKIDWPVVAFWLTYLLAVFCVVFGVVYWIAS